MASVEGYYCGKLGGTILPRKKSDGYTRSGDKDAFLALQAFKRVPDGG